MKSNTGVKGVTWEAGQNRFRAQKMIGYVPHPKKPGCVVTKRKGFSASLKKYDGNKRNALGVIS